MADIMNLAELAEYLKMSQASLYHLVAAGKIPGTKVGKQWRFSKSKIDEWVQGSNRRVVDILVVEDDPTISNLLVSAMQYAGHHATAADSVRKGLILLGEIEFDLVLLDLLLPDGSALDILKATLELPSPPELLMITGHPDHEIMGSIHKLMPDMTVLSKPVRIERLLDLVSRTASARL